MGALILALIVAHRRRILDLAIGATVIGGTVWMLTNFPLVVACNLWALVVVLAVVGLQVRTVGGSDPRLDAEEAERRAAIMRGDR